MRSNETKEVIFGFGHENIQATHRTTLEFTKDMHLSKKGDCIVAVATDKALADLTAEFKEKLRKPQAKLTITIEADEIKDHVKARGSEQLILNHRTDCVIRKSGYVSSRTMGIHADKAAQDLSRDLVKKLKNFKQEVKIVLIVTI